MTGYLNPRPLVARLRASRASRSRGNRAVVVAVAALLAGQAAAIAAPLGLPPGLPDLPAIGERMSTDELSGIALHGFDPVGYFVNQRPTAGLPQHEYNWAGATWRFSSAANRAAFMAEPLVYAPLFDGYDATSVAEGRIVEADPTAFAILAGRIYFFRTDVSRRLFVADAGLRLRSAEAWPATIRQLSR